MVNRLRRLTGSWLARRHRLTSGDVMWWRHHVGILCRTQKPHKNLNNNAKSRKNLKGGSLEHQTIFEIMGVTGPVIQAVFGLFLCDFSRAGC